jgi:multidrug efflux pump subunit AcrA (membrane-fusion protein)
MEFDAIKTVILEKGDLEEVDFADGQVRSNNYARIYSPFSGVLTEIYVSEDDFVEEDELLMEIEITGQTGITSLQEIRAPITGTVTNILADLNTRVVSGQTTLIEIVDLDQLVIEGFVPESDINKVALGQNVRLDFPFLDENVAEKEYSGKVSFVAISPIELNVPNPNYKIIAEIEEIPEDLKFGMTASMEIITQKAEDVLYLDDVFLILENDKTYAIKLIEREKQKSEKIEVMTGFKGENETQIVSGLNEGDEIMLPSIKSENNLFQLEGN